MTAFPDWVPFLAATVLFYGLAQALTKQFMANLTAAAFIVLYVVVKAVINAGAFVTLGTAPLLDAAAGTFIAYAIVGNLINAFAWLFFYKALESGKVSLVGSVTAGYPALTVILALMFLGEKLAWYQGVGVALVIGSGVLVALGPSEPGPDGPAGPAAAPEVAATHAEGTPVPTHVATSPTAPANRWLVYSLLVFVGWGVFSAFIKAAFNAPGAETYTFFVWNALGALVVLLPYGLYGVIKEGGLGKPKDLLVALVPTALFALGDLALFRAYATGPATIVSPLSVVYPLITLLYAAPVLKERISLVQWVAVMLLLVGIVAVSMPA
jgi:transporter family protein